MVHGMDPVTTPVLFLGGAGLPAWIWDDVRAELPPGTESAVAAYPREQTASLADYARQVADEAPWSAFTVVAHSIGGVVAAEVLSRHPERVTGLLGVAAVVPAAGRSFLGSLPFPMGLALGAVMRVVGTRPPAKAIRTGLAAGLPAGTADRIVADFSPESTRLYRDATGPRVLPGRRGYVHTSADRELSPAVQEASAARLDATWTHSLPTGHLPMLEAPATLGDAVRDFLTSTPAHP
jgi:pimeloyl-ACP methyl ester carboxylesterase